MTVPQQPPDLAQRVADLEQQLAAAQVRASAAPLTTVPANAAGPGLEVREAWSLAAQEAAQRGTYEDPAEA